MKFYILIILICLGLSMKIKQDMAQKWTELFNRPTRPDDCKLQELNLTKDGEQGLDGTSAYNRANGLPYKKADFINKSDWAPDKPIQYLFDHFDSVLKDEIIKYFTSLYDEAFKQVEDADYPDPYKQEDMIFKKSNGKAVTDKQKQLEEYFPGTDWKLYDLSISAPKLKTITKVFQWATPGDKNFPKNLVDKYDYKGVGRLSKYEFLQYTIFNSLGPQRQDAKKVYKEIYDSKIDPIFAFLDCNDDTFITSEEIFNNLNLLKRQTPDKYDLYKCKLSENKPIRTNACNDFILRFDKDNNAKLTKEEFRTGILIGYLMRNVKDDLILPTTDESLSGKATRWAEDGAKDLECEKLQRYAGIKTLTPK
jgi:hypothetical protein